MKAGQNVHKYLQISQIKGLERDYNIHTSGETQSLLFLYTHPYFPIFVMKMY